MLGPHARQSRLATCTQRPAKHTLRHGDPFLRWAGGKQLLTARLRQYLPADVEARRYHEPFVGAGSLFFALQPKCAVLSDANSHLINCYNRVRHAPRSVARSLREHARKDSAEHYYAVRELYNRSNFSAAQAARFIYLNRTCFNGIFRVNLRGQFNVPYGFKSSPKFPTADVLCAAATALESATLQSCDFTEALTGTQSSDFVYLDPPYPPLNGTSYFTHYTLDRFGDSDQERLAGAVEEASRRGVAIMMTNADTPRVRRLYSGLCIHKLEVTRYVTCKRVKHKVSELVLTNYEVPHVR